MSYKEYYLSRKLAKEAGFGRKIWLLKLPRLAENPSGKYLLGSLVREVDRFFEKNYPEPFQLTTPELFLKRLKELRDDLGIETGAKLVESMIVSGATISLNQNTDLALETSGNFPGVPVKLDLTVDFESTTSIDIILEDGAEVQYIPTDYLSRLARYYNGDDDKVDPNIAVDIDDHLIVDMIVLVKKYSLVFNQSKHLSSAFGGEAEAMNIKYAGKFAVTRKSEIQFQVTIDDNNDYLLGFKTIDWDNLD